MKILIVGNGGREHTLAWKLAENAEIISTPVNVGIKNIGTCFDIAVDDIDGITKLAKEQNVDLVVVGPELPLTLGLSDKLREAGINVFGPSKAAAVIEGSKIFSKNLMKKYNIPSAEFEVFTEYKKAEEYIERKGAPIVIKADGLAAGKGAVVCFTESEAKDAARSMLVDNKFGTAGSSIVVEEFMQGEEASILALTDGKTIRVLPTSQDHKRIFDGDKGPNTGGMGAYSPANCVDKNIADTVLKKIIEPTVLAMEKENSSYSGVLYVGIMITKDGPKVVEFNCRFGDPETQAVLPLIKGDFAQILFNCATGNLDKSNIEILDGASVCVVLASEGYPGSYTKGVKITDELDVRDDIMLFHAGTKEENGTTITNGGRVLGVVALAENLPNAIKKVYAGINNISFSGMQYRKDIGAKGIKHLNV